MRTKLPDDIGVFVFGSALGDLKTANDIDVLFVYDPDHIKPKDIYRKIKGFVDSLEKQVGLSVHPTVLTKLEEQEGKYIERFKCVLFEKWITSKKLVAS